MADAERPEFVLLGSEELWRGHRLAIERRRFRAPDGEEFERELTLHPGAVGVIAIDDQANVVLVRQFRGPMNAWCLEMPAGTCDVDGEAPEETARRELAEEVGLRANRWELLGALAVSPGVTNQVTRIYLATDLTECETDREGPEERAMTIERVPVATILAKVAQGEALDAPSAAGIALAQLALARRS